MSEENKYWILKVINGPHQGAEISLAPGECVVGNDDECDVVLQDVLIAPQHFSLELTDDAIKLSPLGGRVFCDGARIKDAEANIPPLSFITVGGTHVVIGPSDEPWPLLSISDVPEIKRESEESEEQEAGDADGERDEELPANEEKKEESEDAGDGGDTPAGDKKASRGGKNGKAEVSVTERKQAFSGIFLGVLILLIWAGGIVWFDYREKQEKKASEAENVTWADSPVARRAGLLTGFLSGLSYGSHLGIEKSGERLAVTGFVKDQSLLESLETHVAEQFAGVFVRVRTIDAINEAAQALMKESGLELSTEVRPDGIVKVQGRMSSGDAGNWKSLKAKLVEIPGVTESNIIEQIVIMESGNSNLAGQGGAAEASGARDPRQDKANYPEAVLKMIGVRKDGLNWVRMVNGDVFFKGGTLPNGSTIESIGPGFVATSDAGVVTKLAEGDMAWKLID